CWPDSAIIGICLERRLSGDKLPPKAVLVKHYEEVKRSGINWKATRYEYATEDPHQAATRSPRRRHWPAVRDRRARRGLSRHMPQAITVTDAQGRWAVYVPLRVGEAFPRAYTAAVRL